MPLGLQEQAGYIPPGNPLTAEKVALGKQLYFDTRLSADGRIACATCHVPDKGFSDGRPTSRGVRGQVGGRNAPVTISRLFSKEQFWDGRAASLEEQALGPVQNPIEMGNTLEGLVASLNAIKGYQEQFKPELAVNPAHIGYSHVRVGILRRSSEKLQILQATLH